MSVLVSFILNPSVTDIKNVIQTFFFLLSYMGKEAFEKELSFVK